MNTAIEEPLTFFNASDQRSKFLEDLIENPPTTSEEHKHAASMLLRFAANEARYTSMGDYGRPVDPSARAAALAQMAAVHLQFADRV